MFTNTHTPHRKLAGSALIALGFLTMALGSHMQMEAKLSGQGSILHEEVAGTEMMLKQAAGSAAVIAPENSAGVLAFGMLMMLLGFGLHASIVLQKREEGDRTVRVRAADPAKKKKEGKTARKTRKPLEVIWIERTIRF